MNDRLKERFEKLEFAILIAMVIFFGFILVELANGN